MLLSFYQNCSGDFNSLQTIPSNFEENINEHSSSTDQTTENETDESPSEINDLNSVISSQPSPPLTGPNLTTIEKQKTLHHILVTGQSLSVGPLPAISTTQNYENNFMLSAGNFPGTRGTEKPLIPAVEVSRESPSSSLANTLKSLDLDRVLAITAHGRSGSSYSVIRKGGLFDVYNNGMKQALNVSEEAQRLNYKYNPAAVVLIHGERDQKDRLANIYHNSVSQLQTDYEADLNKLSIAKKSIPLFINQTSAVGPHQMAIAQFKAHKVNPKIFLVAPLYQYRYNDGIHIDKNGSKHLGEQFAKVINQVVFEKKSWNPLMPLVV